MPMATCSRALLFTLAVGLLLAVLAVDAGGEAVSDLTWIITSRSRSGSGVCDDPMGECFEGDEEEYSLDSEMNRRILATTSRHISYGALGANNVPCSKRGASYYNCRPGASANPYRRGCSRITRCRS